MKFDDVLQENFTPMMRQYIDIKKNHKDAIVFFRLGDFYEMFFEDAYTASKELEIALTGRDAGLSQRVPMCGIPFHAYNAYAMKLLEKGYKIAIVEQVSNPSDAKGIVKRDVVKILTPGTNLDVSSKDSNYITCIYSLNKEFVLSYADITTGQINVSNISSLELLINEIINLKTKEVVINSNFNIDSIKVLQDNFNILISYEDLDILPDNLVNLVSGIDEKYVSCVATLLNYILKTQKRDVFHFKPVNFYASNDYLKLDPYTTRNLELTQTLRNGVKNGSLLWLLDKCQTAMGSRMLNAWISKPLLDKTKINNRLDYVEAFNNDFLVKESIKKSLQTVYDLERIVGRISIFNVNAKDLVQLRKTLSNIPTIKEQVKNLKVSDALSLSNQIDTHQDLYNLLETSLTDNPPLTIKEGGIIKDGYNASLDEIKEVSSNSKNWILKFEESERIRTGIKNLKVGYNKVFGYYVEISKSNIGLLDDDKLYQRKQTLANAERFVTDELNKYEQIVVGAHDKIINLEYQLFVEIRQRCLKYITSLQKLADILANIDCLISFSEISMKNKYVRPTFSMDNSSTIINGRHPVIEVLLDNQYVNNDFIVNKYNTLLITGPNMSGKSTYMRQVALISIMAQIGCFVPASSASLKIFDQIFTRIGASDDLINGQSTFMVEMLEANYALSNATANSLILFDELGRGTSTYDGMAIAQSIIEYVHEKIGCVLLFSTHYHELIDLEQKLSRLKNIHVSAKEEKDGIIFLHKIIDGGADQSYGINVAQLAKLPKSLINRSKKILNDLEQNEKKKINIDLFNFDCVEETNEYETLYNSLVDTIKEIDVYKTTPLEALTILETLVKKIK